MIQTYPDTFPPLWASEWGEDRYGLYADMSLAEDKNQQPIIQRFRWIAGGAFMMGSPDNEEGRWKDEDYHHVWLTHGYWLANTTVTQVLWETVMGKNPANFKDSTQNPVENVSRNDVQKFIVILNQSNTIAENIVDLVFRLPTEAEWEHACCAGTTTPFSFGENITSAQVNFRGTSPYANGRKSVYRKKTIAVKSLPANPWGLYEMHGNVWEWCADAWQASLGKQPVTDPYQHGAGSSLRVVRGGSWFLYGRYVRSTFRGRRLTDRRGYDTGFRLLLGRELPSSERS